MLKLVYFIQKSLQNIKPPLVNNEKKDLKNKNSSSP